MTILCVWGLKITMLAPTVEVAPDSAGQLLSDDR